jgi:ABC-type transport system involved in cytochrome c biogenesis ATPase subunit
VITVSHLSRRFGSNLAVDDITFRLERGEVVGFLGPNGAGKTTTMRMLTGFLPPSAGTIEIDGLDVLRDSLAVRAKIGYLPESVPLYREHRVREMLLFQGRLRGLARAETRRRASAVLERVGLADRERSLIGRLSKGQRQRVGTRRGAARRAGGPRAGRAHERSRPAAAHGGAHADPRALARAHGAALLAHPARDRGRVSAASSSCTAAGSPPTGRRSSS